MHSGKPTMRDIAVKVGLTINTVSLSLNDSNRVKPDTKAKVLAIAREMGYVPNVLAGSLRSGKSHTIAILFGDLANLLFAQRISELGRELAKFDYNMLIIPTNENDEDEQKAIRAAMSHRVDGIILCPCQQSRRCITYLREHQIPCVLMGRCFTESPFDSVVWDDKQGALLATEHLLKQGCRRILFINVSEQISSAVQRRAGYEQALSQANTLPLMICVSSMSGEIEEALEELKKQHIEYDGIFAFSDLIALEAAEWLQRQGKKVPEDVALVGFDDVLAFARMPFSLSSIAADREAEAEKTVALLLERMKNQNEEQHEVRLPVKLIARKSSYFGSCK